MKGHCHFGPKVFSCFSMQNFRNVSKDSKMRIQVGGHLELNGPTNLFIVKLTAAVTVFERTAVNN